MRWSARAMTPLLIGAMRDDKKLLEEALFGEQLDEPTEGAGEKCTHDANSPVRVCVIDLQDKRAY
jgi:hypothetical protein